MHTTEQLNAALAGRYAIDHLVGEGGMATVYLAHDVKHRRKVALKVLKPDLGAIVGEDRFLAEIQVTANLQHPNLLPLFDSGVVDSLLFYVMPFVEGESLRARLDREKQLPIDDAIRIAIAMASALDYAHRQGIIHRDLKPENVLLHEGVPMIADFGIALAVRNAGGNRITQTGLSLGTPQYMSPEQATGDRAIDTRTDIYSLGALTYEMLTGEPPHTGSTAQAIIARVLTEKPRSIRASRPSVPLHVDGAVEKALEKLPADRWATAREFAEALAGARPVPESRTARATVASRRAHTREAIAWALAVSGVAATGYVATRRAPVPRNAFAERFTADLPDSFRTPESPFTHVAISNDGRRIAVLGTKKSGGTSMIYVRSLDGDPVFAAVRGSERAASIALSPDGEWVAFHVRNVGVFKLRIAGGTPQFIADSAELPRWGESGDMIMRRVSGGLLLLPKGASKARRLPLDSVSSMIDAPSLLPGGRDVLVSRPSGNGESELVLVSTADGRVTPLDTPGYGPIYSEGRVVFVRPPGLVFSAPFSLRKRAFTADATLLLEDVGGKGYVSGEIAIAGNGTMLYMAGNAAEPRSMVIVDTAGVEQPFSRDYRRYSEPRVSPDGKRVVMRIGESPDVGDVWICDVGACTPTPLTTDKKSVHPEWSRDGARIITTDHVSPDSILVQSRPWDGSGGVETLQRGVGISKEKSVATVSIGSPHGWSAFQRRKRGYGEILIAPTDSLQAPRPLSPPVEGWDPRVSPDGKLLAYSSLQAGLMQVYVRPIPGPGGEIPVSIDAGREPVWSSDGKSLFYRGPWRMMVATVTGQSKPRVTKHDSLFVIDPYDNSDIYGAFDVFPDGKRFLMTRPAKTGGGKPTTLYVVTNWPQLASKQTGSGPQRR